MKLRALSREMVIIMLLRTWSWNVALCSLFWLSGLAYSRISILGTPQGLQTRLKLLLSGLNNPKSLTMVVQSARYFIQLEASGQGSLPRATAPQAPQ
jgi:hypothetical protein